MWWLAGLVTTSASCPENQQGIIKWSTLGLSGTTITIGPTQKVLIDQNITVNTVVVDGQLIVPSKAVTTITASIIAVRNGGRFWAGSSSCPLTGQLNITLTGDITECGNDCPYPGYQDLGVKVLGAISGGQIDLWGKAYTPTWTKLGDHALNGTRTIVLSEAVDWPVGGVIVIASTEFEDFDVIRSGYYEPQNERRTIVALSQDRKTLTLDKPLNYSHYGKIYKPSSSKPDDFIDMRAEVGLLTRNIVIQGDLTSAGSCSSNWGGPPSTPPTNGYNSFPPKWPRCWGAHIHVRGTNAQGRINYVEIVRGGQAREKGRYPIHFHQTGVNNASLVVGNSIYDSLQRCVTTHGTNQLLVRDNVAFNASGHCYFIEDANEEDNIYTHNLGIQLRPHYLLGSDIQPSVFWTTNPYNHFYKNSAVGGHFGYWYAMPEHPLGLADQTLNYANWPRYRPLGDFKWNIAHSNYDSGLFFDRGQENDAGDANQLTSYNPRNWTMSLTMKSFQADPRSVLSLDDYTLGNLGPGVPAVIQEFTAYKNMGSGIWGRASWLFVDKYRSSDNREASVYPVNQNLMQDSVIIGESDNALMDPDYMCVGGWCPSWFPRQQGRRRFGLWWWLDMPIFGSLSYDTGGGDVVVNTRFYNFKDEVLDKISPTHPAYGRTRKAGAISGITGPNTMTPKNQWIGNTFTNVDNAVYVHKWRNPDDKGVYPLFYNTDDNAVKGWIAVDWDGTITAGQPGGGCGAQVVAPSPLQRFDACILKDSWNAYICPANNVPQRAWSLNCIGATLTCNVLGDKNSTRGKLTRLADGEFITISTIDGNYAPGTPGQRLAWNTNLLVSREYFFYVSTNNQNFPARFAELIEVKTGEWVRVAHPYPAGTTFTVYGDYGNTALPAAPSKAQLSFTNPWYWDATSNILWLLFSTDADHWDWAHNAFPVLTSYRRLEVTANCGGSCAAPLPSPLPSSTINDNYKINLCSSNGNGGQGQNGVIEYSVQASPTPVYIFSDTFRTNWGNWSTANSTSPGGCAPAIIQGSSVMYCAFDSGRGWSGVTLYLQGWRNGYQGLSVDGFTHIQMSLRLAPGFGNVEIGTQATWGNATDTDKSGPYLTLTDPRYGRGFVMEAEWRTYTIPLADLSVPEYNTLSRISFSVSTPRTAQFYVDDVRLVAATQSIKQITYAQLLPVPPAVCVGCVNRGDNIWEQVGLSKATSLSYALALLATLIFVMI